MLTLYIRSSLLGTLDFCEHKCFLRYIIGLHDKQNPKATMGSIVHKALEILAYKSIAQRKGDSEVVCDLGTFPINELDHETATKAAFDFYSKIDTENAFGEFEFRQCLDWTYKAITSYNGEFNPLNQKIFSVEEFFDIEVDRPWASYNYILGENKLKGKLRVCGTVDIITEVDDNMYRILDYKTGKRYNWATGEQKNTFEKDQQLLLYYWAIKTKYPDKNFYLTIFYINDGGPYEVVFDKYDYMIAENMIRNRFEYMKSISIPKLLSPQNTHWKCQKLCMYSERWGDSDQSICQHFSNEIYKKGIDAVTAEYADFSRIGEYGDGGGKVLGMVPNKK